MAKYEFRLQIIHDTKFNNDQLVEALGAQGGCFDAVVGVGRANVLALDFSREADSKAQAISSAVADVITAIPNYNGIIIYE